MKAGAQLTFSFLFIQSGTPARGMWGLPTIETDMNEYMPITVRMCKHPSQTFPDICFLGDSRPCQVDNITTHHVKKVRGPPCKYFIL